MNIRDIKQHGIFYTELFNPFSFQPFIDWANDIDLGSQIILEPFAGSNSIIKMLKELNLCNYHVSYDINSQNSSIIQKDTIKAFPKNYSVCITNPPWLYKSSAKRQGLYYHLSSYDNIYKLCLDLALKNCDYVAFLVPASFITSNLFLDRLETIITINKPLFKHTENPVCLAIFSKHKSKNIKVFSNDNFIGDLSELKKHIPTKRANVRFNEPNGELGLIAIDNTIEKSIRFCKGKDLSGYNITQSSRSITRISGIKNISTEQIEILNTKLNKFRNDTLDIFLTAFKGLKKDGTYRRRLDYKLAKSLIGEYISEYKPKYL